MNNIYREMLGLQRQMDRMFNDLWRGGTSETAPLALPATQFAPSCDVNEAESHFLMSFDLPGVKKEDIKITLQDSTLTVSGERKSETEKKVKGHHEAERFYGGFSRSIQLPTGVKPEQVDATYSDGVLRVTVPKLEASKAQLIKIGEGKPSLWEKLTHAA
jgi:HSP20 family protein